MEGTERTTHFLSKIFSSPDALGHLKGESCQPQCVRSCLAWTFVRGFTCCPLPSVIAQDIVKDVPGGTEGQGPDEIVNWVCTTVCMTFSHDHPPTSRANAKYFHSVHSQLAFKTDLFLQSISSLYMQRERGRADRHLHKQRHCRARS